MQTRSGFWIICVSFLIRFVFNNEQKRLFEKLAIYCDRYAELIPVSFVLGESRLILRIRIHLKLI